MPHQRVRLTKRLFMTLQPGQYIMGNFIPLKYEEIGPNPEAQWENWRPVNGNCVDIFDTREECLQMWWSLMSGFMGETGGTPREIYYGKLSKTVFTQQPNGYYLLFLQWPMDYLELRDDREAQWRQYSQANGRNVKIFKSEFDCVFERDELLRLIDARN